MFSQTIFMGRLTAEPETRSTPSGVPVSTFTVAVDREYKENGKKVTDFHRCVAWRAKSDFASKYLRKGMLIQIVGRIQNRKWTDNDGNNRLTTELVVEDFYFTGEPKRDNGMPPESGIAGSDFAPVDDDEDVPF